MVLVKIHKKDGRILAAVCDTELLGQQLEENSIFLDLANDFYKGDEKTDIEAGDIIRNSDHINLVGEKSVALGVHEGLIDEHHIKKVKGVPFAHAVVVHD
ncbi:MAG: DUF424 family protein [Nanoarchaeota archaeon]